MFIKNLMSINKRVFIVLGAIVYFSSNLASFSFNHIAGDRFYPHELVDHQQTQDKKITYKKGLIIEQDKSGKILRLYDEKKNPLILGSMPTIQDNLDQLKKTFNRDFLEIFTLNQPFERDRAGLTALIAANKKIVFFQYPTPDGTAPTVVDLLRIIRDLMNRDSIDNCVAFVHCLMGCGRSPLAVGAYLVSLLHDGEIEVTTDNIEQYLKSRRPQVGLNMVQKIALFNFQQELKQAGSFNKLYEKYETKIEQRDNELLNLNRTYSQAIA